MARKTSFYYSFLVLPPAQRHAIIAVWDFCRAVDDAVDEAPQGTGAEAVQFWRAELARCYDGTAPQTEQGRRLQPFIAGLDLPRQAFTDVIDGVAMDLDTHRYDTFADLWFDGRQDARPLLGTSDRGGDQPGLRRDRGHRSCNG